MRTFELNARDPHGTIAMRKESFSQGGKTVLRFPAPNYSYAICILIWTFGFSAEDFDPNELRRVKNNSTTTPPHCDQFNSLRVA